jgi:transposase
MKPDTSLDATPVAGARKRYTKEFKQRLVRLSLAPGASAAKIALKHQINTHLLFKWRRRYLREMSGPAAEAMKLLPVTVRQSSEELQQPAQAAKRARPSRCGSCGTLEIELPEARIVAKGDVAIELLRSAVQIVRSR